MVRPLFRTRIKFCGLTRAGDVLLKLAGSETNSLAELRSLIEAQGVGATVPVLIGRNGEQFTLQVQLSEVPNE